MALNPMIENLLVAVASGGLGGTAVIWQIRAQRAGRTRPRFSASISHPKLTPF